MGLKLISGQIQGKAALKCGFCEEKFPSKKDLATHKYRKHKTYKPCQYFKEGNCKRSPCRFYHKIIKEGSSICFDCAKEFSEKLAEQRRQGRSPVSSKASTINTNKQASGIAPRQVGPAG